MRQKFNTLLFLLLIMLVHDSAASETILSEQRAQFLLAEKMIKERNEASFLRYAEQLKDYPLYPYLQYQWLLTDLAQTKKIKNFLSKYKKTRYANLLKYKWQLYLAKDKNWREFIMQYKKTRNIKLQCYFYQAKFSVGKSKEALVGARKIWVKGKSLPAECDPIFKVLKASRYFTRETLWQRFNAAITKKNIRLARYVKRFMNKRDQQIAQTWLKIHSQPALVNNPSYLGKTYAQSGLIFAHAIDRLASKDLTQAISLWDTRKNNFIIDHATQQRIEHRLAMSLAYRGNELAYNRLSKLDNPDVTTQEWRVRTALKAQNWPQVEQSISELNTEVKNKGRWKYWLARALEETNRPKVADFMFTQLSKERSYYGYLSADKLNKNYQLEDDPVQVMPVMFKRFKQKQDFRVVAEFIKVDKRLEARRQWWYAVNKLEKKEILMAAKYAQELKWNQVAIFTIAKAKYWNDIKLRFPMGYKNLVMKNADRQKLNPAVIFGLIRRESAFNQNAKSPVGARGLMQIMPKTGQQIARELKEKWKSTRNLLDPSVNVKYGSYYYKRLLNRFKGHYALAAAAYNAGAHRVNRWLPEKGRMAADVWVETIPFKETRAYVSAVLTYALIYQKRLKKKVLSMKGFMLDVLPKKQ